MSEPLKRYCPKCYNEIEHFVNKCPHCTADIGRQSIYNMTILQRLKMTWLVIVVTIILANTKLIDCRTPDQQMGFFGIFSLSILIQLIINAKLGLDDGIWNKWFKKK